MKELKVNMSVGQEMQAEIPSKFIHERLWQEMTREIFNLEFSWDEPTPAFRFRRTHEYRKYDAVNIHTLYCQVIPVKEETVIMITKVDHKNQIIEMRSFWKRLKYLFTGRF